jgi:alcohol dehydrogenase (quinone), cytochrome c subunit
MKRRRVVVLVFTVPLLGLALLAGISQWSDSIAGEKDSFYAADASTLSGNIDHALLVRGEYLAKLGDCGACHSTPGQPPFSGGLKMGLPIGAIYTTNITPDKTYGIGRFTLADFDRALRFGVANGHTLYPAMPFASYAIITSEDVKALYAYFEFGVTPAPVPNRKSDILFPLSMRWPLTYWRLAFALKPTPFDGKAFADLTVARGAYFVEGLGHCGECHTPRGMALQVKAQNGRDGDEFLRGGPVENWYAPSLRNGGPDTIAAWSEAQISQFLQSGANHSGIAFGSMSDVIVNSTQFLSAEDSAATAKYLKTLQDRPAGGRARFEYDERTDRELASGDAKKRGALLYLDNCAACHRPDGRGYEGVFPSLAGNPVVEAGDPLSLVSIVLLGSTTSRTSTTPAQFAMPAFAWRLTDQDAADVISFIRSSWGNDAKSIDAPKVAALRPSEKERGGAEPPLRAP